MKRHGFIYRNGLSVAFLVLMLLSVWGQAFTGWKEHNSFLADYGKPATSFAYYLKSGHFIQATFENWESEFFQMALFVILSIFLKQEGSSESRPLEEGEADKENECSPKPDAPWAVKKGGFYLLFYKHSLSISLLLLFLFSFFMHWYGSWIDFNEKQTLGHKSAEPLLSYLSNSKFWFESFQNWQSEFLSIFAIVFLSIYLRQAGSPQSKRVNDAHRKTGG